MTRIAIIGAGMTGLACARKLADAGHEPVLFDKGRGIGGRLATKRIGVTRFDHGAQYVVARDQNFVALLNTLQEKGAVGIWQDGSGRTRFVGVPGMSALPRALSSGLEIRQQQAISAIRRDQAGWSVRTAVQEHLFDRVVITVPSPQIEGLLGKAHLITTRAAQASYAPCLTLMALINARPRFSSLRNEVGSLSWIAHDGSKPGRPKNGPSAWVAQAGIDFSVKCLEEDPVDIAARMVPLLCDALAVSPDDVVFARAHRWRFARVTAPLGQGFIKAGDTLYAGGDWCLGPRVEAAYQSGSAIAQDILRTLN